jgi:hypothetical protein
MAPDNSGKTAPRIFMRTLLALVLFPGISSTAFATKSDVEVNVVVDMTPEGRKIPHPDAAHPAYYVPLAGGYTELNSPVAGEKAPPLDDIMHLVEASLARQGFVLSKPTPYVNPRRQVTYADGTVVMVPRQPLQADNRPQRIRLVPLTVDMIESADGAYSAQRARLDASKGQPSLLAQIINIVDPVHGAVVQQKPSIMLVVHWGYSAPTEENQSLRERQQTLSLVGGYYASNIVILTELEPLVARAHQDRYFIYITAYEFDAYLKLHTKVLLWQAKVSVPWNGVTFDDVLPSLVRAVEPVLGRETTKPILVDEPVTPLGRVIIGTPREQDDQDPARR